MFVIREEGRECRVMDNEVNMKGELRKIGVCEFLKGGKQWYHKAPEK